MDFAVLLTETVAVAERNGRESQSNDRAHTIKGIRTGESTSLNSGPETDLLRYDLMMKRALRNVLRETLEIAAEKGLPGNHHLYITFKTQAPGVEMADYLVARYPEEMTIVLQHEYWGLEVEDERFAVTLSFSNRHERLTVPFESVSAFADPSVRFGLQFEKGEEAEDDEEGEEETAGSLAPPPAAEEEEAREESGKVVALDRFRKKEG